MHVMPTSLPVADWIVGQNAAVTLPNLRLTFELVALRFGSHSYDRVIPGDVLPVVAAGRAVARRREPVRRGVRREHGNAFDAERSAIHDVVVVPLHRQELAVPDGGDHAAPARAEVAGGGELADV